MKVRNIAGVCSAVFAVACLPKDDRPPPAEVLVTATSDDLLREGIPPSATADGWSIEYEKSFVSFGHFTAEGDDCTLYSTPGYARILDMQREGPQKVVLLHALGTCVIDFELNGSGPDEPVGEGVTPEVKTFMLTTADDPYSVDSAPTIHLAGRAERNGVEKTFAWSYRHSIDYEECGPLIGDDYEIRNYELESGADLTIDVAIRGGALFQLSLYAEVPPLGFQAFADADTVYGNDDGVITLEELSDVPLSDIATADRYADANAASPVPIEDANEPDPWTSLGDYVYFGLFPLVLRVEGSDVCGMDRFMNDRSPD